MDMIDKNRLRFAGKPKRVGFLVVCKKLHRVSVVLWAFSAFSCVSPIKDSKAVHDLYVEARLKPGELHPQSESHVEAGNFKRCVNVDAQHVDLNDSGQYVRLDVENVLDEPVVLKLYYIAYREQGKDSLASLSSPGVLPFVMMKVGEKIEARIDLKSATKYSVVDVRADCLPIGAWATTFATVAVE